MAACRECSTPLLPGKVTCLICGAMTINDLATGDIKEARAADFVGLDEIDAKPLVRLSLGDPFDAAWGGGLVPTTTTLLGGYPGCGKSTCCLQLCSRLVQATGKYALYVQSEQDKGEIKLTTERLQIPKEISPKIRLLKDMGAGGSISDDTFRKYPPCLIVLDSMNALVGKDIHYAVEIAKRYKTYSVKYGAPVIIIGHMQKQGDFSGLMKLQHEVDTLILLEFNEKKHQKVILAYKNRYGPTLEEHEVIMTETGLVPPPPKSKKESKLEAHLAAAWMDKLIEGADEELADDGLRKYLRSALKELIHDAVAARIDDKLRDSLGDEIDAMIDTEIQPPPPRKPPAPRKRGNGPLGPTAPVAPRRGPKPLAPAGAKVSGAAKRRKVA